MATVDIQLAPQSADFLSTNGARYSRNVGTNFPVCGLAFDASTEKTAFWSRVAKGLTTITDADLEVIWYADTASSGGVVWGVSLQAITPNTDTQDVETDAMATEQTSADTHLGTTGQRLHSISVDLSGALDSIAGGDWFTVKVARKVADASDTMTGDAFIVGLVLTLTGS